MTQEDIRIQEKDNKEKDWLKWGPYLSERQWGTVREDYSESGDAWNYTTYPQAKSIAWRWGEDGIAGISDNRCNLCFSVAMWNGKDDHLKERLFGLSNPQGNHGEDVKELYYYLDNTPTHAFMKYLYKYPHRPFPYQTLIEENAKRGLEDLEFELPETGVFKDNAYTDIYIEYAKADQDDILIKISAANRSSKPTEIHLLPQLFIKNEWDYIDIEKKPIIEKISNHAVRIDHYNLGEYFFYFEEHKELLFTENQTNKEVIHGEENDHPYKKDLFHTAIISGDLSLPTSKTNGTKFSPYSQFILEGNATQTIRLRLSKKALDNPFTDFDHIFYLRAEESNNFYRNLYPELPDNLFQIKKQAFAGLLWTKQFYHYNIEKWLEGDKAMPNPPAARKYGKNASWTHARNYDILLMPDKWEYPWYASWDSAFHVIAMAEIDLAFAKEQLLIFLKDWYMKPNGQIPSYEWNFDDVNPPVQPWAVLMIYQIEKRKKGKGDIHFLKRMFHKLTLNFTWWVNRLDTTENNVFEGGFLGMDNIGLFDRSEGIPGEASLEQVDGTSWVALYCLSMLKISLLISTEDSSYEDMAVKFFGHFVFIAESLNHIEEDLVGNWDKADGFFYDKLIYPDGREEPVKVRSLVGMLALIAILEIPEHIFDTLPRFKRSYLWFKNNRVDKLKFPVIQEGGQSGGILLSLVPKDRLDILMKSLLDEKEFLSDYGIRSLSKIYENPYIINLKAGEYSIQYTPAESDSAMFGGNSNWRGPIWFPMNYLLIDSLRELDKFYGDKAQYAFPTGSSNYLTLDEVSNVLSKRLISIFDKDENNQRPVHLLFKDLFQQEYFDNLITFYEYFHGDNGRGVGASHQTGWTALVANLILGLDAKDF